MFILYEIHVRGFKLIDDRIWVGNVWEIIPMDHLRVLEEGPKTVGMAVPSRPKRRSSRLPVLGVTPRQRVPL